MKPDDNHYYRVVGFSGETFYTRARNTAEFVLDPVFLQFLTLSVILFTSLMLALEIPAIQQVVLFGAVIVTTMVLLSITIAIYHLVVKLFGFITFYTPLLLIPMVTTNSIFFDYLLRLFGTSYIDGFNGFWEVSIRTGIIIVCLEIMHTKFVAPHHRMTVRLDENGKVVPLHDRRQSQPSASAAAMPLITQDHIETVSLSQNSADNSVAPETSNPQPSVAPQDTNAAQNPEPIRELVIGRETFDLEAILYIKSEDHYLVLHKANQTEMVRGRLREVATKIDAQRGVQINRSVWVAYSAIAEVQETSKGQLNVQLSDGEIMRVANSRKVFFEHGCTQYAPDVAWNRG